MFFDIFNLIFNSAVLNSFVIILIIIGFIIYIKPKPFYDNGELRKINILSDNDPSLLYIFVILLTIIVHASNLLLLNGLKFTITR